MLKKRIGTIEYWMLLKEKGIVDAVFFYYVKVVWFSLKWIRVLLKEEMIVEINLGI